MTFDRRPVLLAAFAATTMLSPATAQDAPRTLQGLNGFSLAPSGPQPTPTPTPTPSPAIPPLVPPVSVPVAPPSASPQPRSTTAVRRSPTPTSTPTPGETTRTPALAPAPRPTPQPAPDSTPTAATAADENAKPTPTPMSTPGAVPTPTASPASSTAVVVPAAAPAPMPTPNAPLWPWLVGLAALSAAGWAWARSRGRGEGPRAAEPIPSQPAAMPPTASPVAAAPASAEPRAVLALQLRPTRAGLNMLSATVDCEVTVANRGERPARDVRVAARLLAAGDAQESAVTGFAGEPIVRPAAAPFALAPGEERRLRVVLALQRDAIAPMAAGGRAMFIPVVAVNVVYAAGEGIAGQVAQAFAVGIERVDSPKLAPLWLDGPPKMHDTVAARAHAVAIER